MRSLDCGSQSKQNRREHRQSHDETYDVPVQRDLKKNLILPCAQVRDQDAAQDLRERHSDGCPNQRKE